MKNLKIKFTHFSILATIALSIFMASCEDTEINLTCSDLDYIALRALYLSTDGDNWTDNTGWMTAAEFETNTTIPAGTDMGTWYGISTNTDGCVTCIDMDGDPNCGSLPPFTGNGLTGNLPPQIGLMQQLTDLLLIENQLTGSLPTEIGNLAKLRILRLDDNNFNGSIPTEIGNLTGLLQLSMTGNQFSGNIPPEIGNLTGLSGLQLSGNQLSGSIPPEIASLTNLDVLALLSNQLSGTIPAELGNLPSLFILELHDNQLVGSIPPEIGNLSMLQIFAVFNNQLSGCYDSNLSNLCNQLLFGDGITPGNNFDASWGSFCATGAGTCAP